jgi:hypothetical protein
MFFSFFLPYLRAYSVSSVFLVRDQYIFCLIVFAIITLSPTNQPTRQQQKKPPTPSS